MALRLGIGDVFTICKGAVDVCKAIHDEPAEVQSVIAEMKLMRAHLKGLETQIGDEKSFARARPDITPVIKRSLEPLHKDLLDMKEMLHQHTRKQSMHIVDQVRYMVLYKAKLNGFLEKLPAHRESICAIQELIQGQTQSERRMSTVKLFELVENQEREQKKQDEYDRTQREVLKIFEERMLSSKTARHQSSCEMVEQLEEDLVAKGLSPESAAEQIFPITKALLLRPLPGNPNQRLTIQKPTFKLDVFEPVSHTAAAGDLHSSNGTENSQHKKASTTTRMLDARASSSDNLLASCGGQRR